MTINDVSKYLNIARNHLVKIVASLSQLGYIKTLRGAKGGFCLNQDPESINIGEVVLKFEPTLEVVNCKMPECPFRNQCKLKTFLDDATLAFVDVLKSKTLSDVTHF